MPPTLFSAASLDLEEIAELFAESFEGYIVPLVSTVEALAARVRMEQIDLALSRIIHAHGDRAGLSLLARRGRRVRVAAMGIVARKRGRGLGSLLLEDTVQVARAAGARTLLLEVLGVNKPAIALYESGGFRTTRRLVGHNRPSLDPSPAPEHHIVDVEVLAEALASEPDRPWSWQLSPHSLVAATAPLEVHALGKDAFAALIPVGERPDRLSLRILHVAPPKRRTGLARRLLAAIQARYPGASWDIPPVVPEGFGSEALAALGFSPSAMFQLEMERPL